MSEQIPHRRQRCPALTRLCLLGTLLLAVGVAAFAQEQRPLRFAVIEGWAMPMMQFVDGQTTTGILYDLYMHLAQKVGRDAELVLIPRLRAQSARARGEIDVHCYVNPSWHQDSHHQYIWSQPLLVHHDLIVGRSAEPDFTLEKLHGQRLGTVLGFNYPGLQALFDSARVHREDVRTQALVMEKLEAGRYRYAVSNNLSLDWFNRHRSKAERLHALGEISSDLIYCLVRDAPDVPTQALLGALVQMKQDGELEAILARYR
ncbi:Bacterial extracellular solute-binding protein, family 3 [Pseudomonas sp. THAF187a]|uniref:substrate-binding periplasmic protein n=1 Tax=unclassified Pseudomonas TaxID=196821 RepID=UPI0012683E91|nr:MULTISPECIES: transporter substrate-binding domain-containing protein [unclassified Pseudomonas]QFT21488.1 Bacterial extracellular solute-binding protein, family 3 [Pseudomonas sp. THAF187a]QFT41676.1 Bacterial extracellular solute-binding protein, family 3 [Pseudomonas sp. THAF42]